MDARSDAATAGDALPGWLAEVPPPGPATGDRLVAMTTAEAREVLRSVPVGRIAFVAGSWPVVLPVNFALDGEDIVFRTGPGAKLAAVQAARVAFQADAADAVYHSGWSVLAFGVAEEVLDAGDLARLSRLAVRPWAGGVRPHWVRVRVVQLTGRRIPRAWRYPAVLP